MNAPKKKGTEASKALKNLEDFGYHIMLDQLSQESVTSIIDSLKTQSVRRTPLNEKNQSQWWDEITCLEGSKAAQLMFHDKIRKLISENWSAPAFCVYWANVYRAGEHIPYHKDTVGDLQLITGLISPHPSNGGDLILHHKGKRRVQLQPGQQLLFRASRTPHQTITLKSSEAVTQPIRCVGISRIFFNELSRDN